MTDVRRILCPIDFSEASRAALDQAASIAEWFGAAITAVHVSSPARVIEGPLLFAALPVGDVSDTPASRAQRALIECVRPLRDRGLAVDAVVVEDSDVDGRILAIAKTVSTDLLVIGTHGRTGLDWLIVGSVTDKILRHATCPVLTVPPSATHRARPPFKRLLCPIDFSEPSLEALRFAVPLAEEGDARLTLLHVLPDPRIAGWRGRGGESGGPRPLRGDDAAAARGVDAKGGESVLRTGHESDPGGTVPIDRRRGGKRDQRSDRDGDREARDARPHPARHQRVSGDPPRDLSGAHAALVGWYSLPDANPGAGVICGRRCPPRG